jgi:arylsulfatase A-like enzyme
VTAWTRYALALTVSLLGCVALELLSAWPDGAGASLLARLASQVFALSVLWVLPWVTFVFLVAGAITPVLFRDDRGGPPAYVTLIPVGLLVAIGVGRTLHRWIAGAVERPENAHRVLPALEVLAGALLLLLLIALYRGLRRWLERVPAWARRAVLALTPLALWVYIRVQVPALAEHALFPALLVGGAIALVTTVIRVLPDAYLARLPVRLGRRGALITAGALLAAAVGSLVVASRAGIAQSAVRAELEHGLVAPRLFAALQGLSDRDGDGFTSILGGLDCDDADAAVHPLAHDTPGDGIDQDCFDGDSGLERARGLATPRAAATTPPIAQNAILITIDAARADAFGFGGAPYQTPALDGLAAAGVVFERAYTQAARTRRSLPALLYGRYPSRIVWERPPRGYKHTLGHLRNRSLGDLAGDHGVASGIFLPFQYKGVLALGQAFDVNVVLPESKEGNAAELVDAIIAQLRAWRAAGERFFVWAHFYEPHYPYKMHEGFAMEKSRTGRYASEIRFVDAEVGRLLAELDASGLAASTAVIVSADHGEEHGEHGGGGHGELHVENLHVPLVMRAPGVAPRRVAEPVAEIDIAPTIAELLGFAAEPDHDGDSLLGPARDGTPPARPYVISETIPERNDPTWLFSIIDARWQLVADYRTAGRALHDLGRDRYGIRNCIVEHADAGAAIERQLRSLIGTQLGPIEVQKAAAATRDFISSGVDDEEAEP